MIICCYIGIFSYLHDFEVYEDILVDSLSYSVFLFSLVLREPKSNDMSHLAARRHSGASCSFVAKLFICKIDMHTCTHTHTLTRIVYIYIYTNTFMCIHTYTCILFALLLMRIHSASELFVASLLVFKPEQPFGQARQLRIDVSSPKASNTGHTLRGSPGFRVWCLGFRV